MAAVLSNIMIPQLLTSTLEVVINKTLALSSSTASLEQLVDKTLTLELAEFTFPLSFSICKNSKITSIVVTSLTERSDCTIKTSISTLQELKAEQQITELIKQDKLDLTGDAKVAQQFANIAENLDIDWQSELASHIGDVPTHKLIQLSKRVAQKAQFASQQIKADASEYIVHEKRLVVTHSQIEHFNQQVSNVDQQVNELEQRISKLIDQQANL